jgi:hypothetical protein
VIAKVLTGFSASAGTVSASDSILTAIQKIVGNATSYLTSANIEDAINDGTTTKAPSENAVFDALALKAPLASPTFTGTPVAPTAAAGTNTTQLATTAYVVAAIREKLSAARTYYVRTDGSDSNTGLANTSGGAFLTIQKAVTVAATLDNNGFDITIQIADGTYNEVVELKSGVGDGFVIIQGNSGTPANVIVNVGASQTCFHALSVTTKHRIKDMKFTGSSSFYSIFAEGGSYIEWGNNNFGTGFTTHLRLRDLGHITCISNYTISGGAGSHWESNNNALLRCSGFTITISGTPAFSSAFAGAAAGGMVVSGNTFSGSATGVRYNATVNGYINTNGGGATYLPGGTGGSTATGGQYI